MGDEERFDEQIEDLEPAPEETDEVRGGFKDVGHKDFIANPAAIKGSIVNPKEDVGLFPPDPMKGP